MTAVGAESAIGDVSSNEPAVIWKVTDITVDPQCTQSFSIPAVNGHLISASLEVETTDIYSADFRASFAPQNDWTIVGAMIRTCGWFSARRREWAHLPGNDLKFHQL